MTRCFGELSQRQASLATCIMCACMVCMGTILLVQSRFAIVREGFLSVNRLGAKLQKDPSGLYSQLELHGVRIPRLGGCVWDVGAHDGVYTSNSFHLINHRQFRAWLFEPSPWNFIHLLDLYSEHEDQVSLFNMALAPDVRLLKMRTFVGGTEDSVLEYKTDQYDNQPQTSFWLETVDAELICEQHARALSEGLCNATFDVRSASKDATTIIQKQFSLISIDTEGLDMNIIMHLYRKGCLDRFNVLMAESVNHHQLEEMGFMLAMRRKYVTVYTM